MSKVFALYQKQNYPTPDEFLDEYETESEARENLRVLEKDSDGSYYIGEQEETHRPWLVNADSFCYGIVD